MNAASSHDVTQLLARWSAGDPAAREALVPLVYNELRHLARRCLAGQQHQTLQSTALVHEAYLRLVGQNSLTAVSRSHFLAIAARLMREILVDHARSRGAAKHGANCITLTFDEAVVLPQRRELDLVALDDALKVLAAMDARQSQIVDLRFFGGLSIEEAAEVLEDMAGRCSLCTVSATVCPSCSWERPRAGYSSVSIAAGLETGSTLHCFNNYHREFRLFTSSQTFLL